MFGSINMEVGRLINDDGIEQALDTGESGLNIGIIKRCLDYDKNYGLKRLGFNKDQRAVGAIYIFSKELELPEYKRLEKAIRAYAAQVGASAVFPEIDKRLIKKDGQLYWNP